MKSAIVVVLLVNFEFGTRVFGRESGDPCGSGLGRVWHATKGGQFRCCVNITCDRGTEAHLCENDNGLASCISCKPGAFQSHPVDSFRMRKCLLHRSCAADAVVILPGSATSDVICTCNLKLGYYGFWPDCKKYLGKGCESGHQLMLNGECEKCPPNSYQNSSSQSQCSLCSRCDSETQEIASNCTAVSDRICRNKTLGRILDEVNYLSREQFLLPIILGVFVPVMVVAVVMPLCLKKCRNGGASKLRASISSGSTSHSDPSIENGPGIDQYDGNRLRQEVKENHYQRKTEVDDNLLRRISLCESDIHQKKSNSDFDDHRRSDSEGLLNSPSDDTSVVDAPVYLVDERESVRDREDNQPSFQCVVESANERTDSLPSYSQGAIVMNGRYNVNNGNIYLLRNCHDIKFVQPQCLNQMASANGTKTKPISAET